MIWPALLLASLSCYLVKLAGLSVPQRVLEDRRVRAIAAALPLALLAALAATQAFTTGHRIVLDARAVGVLAAVIAIRFRAPFLITVGIAALTTALVRLTM